MIADLDRATVMTVIELADAANAAGSPRGAARGGPASGRVSRDGTDLVPSGLTAEERSLHDHLGGLDDRTMARLLALYWLGRRAAFAEPADADAYHVLLAHAEENLDHAPRYLTMKPSLGGILRAGLAILGV